LRLGAASSSPSVPVRFSLRHADQHEVWPHAPCMIS